MKMRPQDAETLGLAMQDVPEGYRTMVGLMVQRAYWLGATAALESRVRTGSSQARQAEREVGIATRNLHDEAPRGT